MANNFRVKNTDLAKKVGEIDASLEQINNKMNKIYDTFDPIYYGADPKGLIPSSDAINQCIINNKGKSIKFTPGKYLIDKPIITPYYVDEQVNIDFNGSILFSDLPLEYVIGVGMYNYGNEMPNRNDYTSKTCYSILSNFVIDAKNCKIGILTNQNYWYPRIINASIFCGDIGIKVGLDSTKVWSSDLMLNNVLIQCNDYKNINSRCLVLNGHDNKISNCRFYNAYIGIESNKGGNIYNDVHVYLYGHLNERETASFKTIYPTTIGILENSSNNKYNNVYVDSYSTLVKVYANYYVGQFTLFTGFTNVLGYDDIAFDFSNCPNISSLTIENSTINLQESGENGNIGLKLSNTQRWDDFSSLVNLRNNFTNFIEKDLLLMDMNRNQVSPYDGVYLMEGGKYYIIGYIRAVAFRSITVNITGTGSDKQRVRMWINENEEVAELNNKGEEGDDFSIGTREVILKDGLKYVEISVKRKVTNSANLGIKFDAQIDGMNDGIIPVLERHIHGVPIQAFPTKTIDLKG